jgi:hypothetical protein
MPDPVYDRVRLDALFSTLPPPGPHDSPFRCLRAPCHPDAGLVLVYQESGLLHVFCHACMGGLVRIRVAEGTC